MFSIFDVVKIFLAGWMLLTGHYPLNLDLALHGWRTRKWAFEPNGNWVRISGGLYLVGFLLSTSSSELSIIYFIVFGAATLALILSFLSSFIKGL